MKEIWGWGRNVPGGLGQFTIYWSRKPLHCQAISSHDIDYGTGYSQLVPMQHLSYEEYQKM